MLCFGQSAFFRFNHPEEAFRMKSMMPQGGSVSTRDYRLCAGTVWHSQACSYYTHSLRCFTVFSAYFHSTVLPLNVMSGFPSSTNTGPVWIKTHWPFVPWIIRPKKNISLLKFQFQFDPYGWMGPLVSEPNSLMERWSSREAYFTGGCLHSSKPWAFFLFIDWQGWRKWSIQYWAYIRLSVIVMQFSFFILYNYL